MIPLVKAMLTIRLLYFPLPGPATEITILKGSEQRVVFETDFGHFLKINLGTSISLEQFPVVPQDLISVRCKMLHCLFP